MDNSICSKSQEGCVRNRSFLPGILFLIIALSIPAIIFAQNRSVRHQPSSTPERVGTTSAPGSRTPVTSSVVKGDIAEALSVIQSNYIDGKKLDYNNIFKSSKNGMLSVLDPHSTYFDPIEYASFKTEQRSEYFGIGATIGNLRQGEQVNTYIRATFEDAPAARAGLRFGDRILEVDGQSMRGKTFSEVRKFLLGPRGTVVKVTVEHPANGQTQSVSITRDAVPLPSIPLAYVIRPGVGYVAMTGGFNLTTADEFEEALQDLHSKGMNTLILDLRGNRGGLLIQAVRVANTFLQRGQLIVAQKGRIRGSSENFAAVNDTPDMVPLVVLVNKDTASAAEIVAGALQDHDRALIVGETTFGKGLVQTIMPLRNVRGYALALTTARYYTPSGRSIQRDYASTALEEYYAPRDRKPCEQGTSDMKLTDVGRKVYGGDGITPDYCVDPEAPGKFVAHLVGRQAFVNFARGYEAAEGQGTAQIAGTGSRSTARSARMKVVGRDFKVDEKVLADFRNYLDEQKVRYTPEDLAANRETVSRQIEEEVVRQVFGEGEARKRSLAWDPQVRKALELIPRADLLLRDPQTYVVQRESERKLASTRP